MKSSEEEDEEVERGARSRVFQAGERLKNWAIKAHYLDRTVFVILKQKQS